MVVCSRTFFDFIGEGLQKEALVQRQGMCLMYNETSRYAETARLTVSVENPQGAPQSGAWVRFYVLNMAGLAPDCSPGDRADGAVTLETGLGSLLVEAELNGKFAWSTLKSPGTPPTVWSRRKRSRNRNPGPGTSSPRRQERKPAAPDPGAGPGKGCRSGIGPAGPPGPDRKLLEPPVRNRRRSSGPGVPDGRRKRRSPVAVLPDHPGRPASPGPRLCFSAWPLRTGGM